MRFALGMSRTDNFFSPAINNKLRLDGVLFLFTGVPFTLFF